MSARIIAATTVTIVSLALLGGVALLTTTPLGCGPAERLGLNGIVSRCRATANLSTAASPSPAASPTSAYTPPVSEPFSPPVSAPYVPPTPDSRFAPQFQATPGVAGGPITPAYQLTCKLPVYSPEIGKGGFIQFPDGNFVVDPTSDVPPPSPDPLAPAASNYGPSYDPAFSRWVPVPYSQVSTDGSHYAYTTIDAVHVVTLPAGTASVLGKGRLWTIVSLGTQGVYAMPGSGPGLWLLAYSGGVQQVTASGYWYVATQGYAYGIPTNPLTYNSVTGLWTMVWEQIATIRVDLKTGALATWFARDNAISTPFGIDAQGDPVIQVRHFDTPHSSTGIDTTPTVTEFWIATGPNDATGIFSSASGMTYVDGYFADTRGIWFRVDPPQTSIQLYVPGSGLYAMSSLRILFAGRCV